MTININTQNAATTLPLSDLRLDEKANVRHVGRGEASRAMIASIRAHGLKQPLHVRPNGKGHVVVDGGKRLTALQELAKSGDIAADQPVPVVIQAMDDNAAREVSLALNVVRTAMHPVDEFRAFVELATGKEKLTEDAIAERFGIPLKGVRQRLALGKLDESILTAWRDGKIGENAAMRFTLQPDKAAQARALKQLLKEGDSRPNDYHVSQVLKLDDKNMGRWLPTIGFDAYEKRGGTIIRDLFGDKHQVSKPALVQAMLDEEIEKTCKRLVEAGWSFAVPTPENGWQWGRQQAKDGKATAEEEKRMKELDALVEDEGQDEEDAEKWQDEHDVLSETIKARGFTDAQKKAGGCFVGLGNGAIVIQYGRTKPATAKATATQVTASKSETKKKAKPKPGTVSKALQERLSQQLTKAAQVTLGKQPNVAVAALIAGIATGTQIVTASAKGAASINERGYYDAWRTQGATGKKFEAAFLAALKLTPAKQAEALGEIAAKAVDFVYRNADTAAIDNAGIVALCNAIDKKAFNKAARDTFDAKDYFAGVGRATIVAAVTEAIGKQQGDAVAKMDKAGAVKFAVANLPKTGWLPRQLRTKHYDGPKAK